MSTKIDDDIVMTVEEAAQFMRMTEDQLWKWINEPSGLPIVPVGNLGPKGPADVRVFRSDLLGFAKARARVRRPAESPSKAGRPRRKPAYLPGSGGSTASDTDPLGAAPIVVKSRTGRG